VLAEFKIKSFGIIDQIDWSLDAGFNVITGETGAGKSLVIDALEALLDGRLAEESIRFGADAARMEAVFFLSGGKQLPRLMPILEEKGVVSDGDNLVIGCEYRRQGRSILRVNGNAVPRSLLRELGSLLVDIHGQSEHLSLFDRRRHLEYLDTYAHCVEARDAFSDKAAELGRVEQGILNLNQAEKERTHREEILHYQVDEIKRAKLKEGEEEELGSKRQVMASCEKLKALAYEVYQALDGDDGLGAVALSRLNEAARAMAHLVSLDPSLKSQKEALESAIANLQEMARDVRSYEERLEYDPRQLEEIEARLETIHALKKKYGDSIMRINEYLTGAQRELETLASSAEEKGRLEEKRLELKAEMGHLASELSRTRCQAAVKLQAAVKRELAELNMPQVEFEVSIKQMPSEDGLPVPDGQHLAFNKDGVDEVEFMVSTNPGEPLKPLADIASTGEVSRFTLALKVALAEADRTPVLVFDEIDIGVGGRSGDIIGRKLWSLARHHQVICVTHLPQIAVFADRHYSVRKEASGERTTSLMEILEGEGRVRELAVMLGGAQYSETSIKNARELSQKAQIWTESQRGNS